MEVLDRARAYAAAVPGAISGGGGHNQTFTLANALTWGFGLDDEAALRVLLEWNAGCQPPWSERELRHKLQQSRKVNHPKPFGHLIGAGERCAHPHVWQAAPPAETTTWKIKRRPAAEIAGLVAAKPSQASQVEAAPQPSAEKSGSTPSQASQTAIEWPPLVAVPGCRVGRPPEITMADEDWRALEASGLAEEPCVQLAAQMFGPGCTIIETGRATPCE